MLRETGQLASSTCVGLIFMLVRGGGWNEQ